MKKMLIFEPAMCCPTGLCGPSIDPELFRLSTVINNLKKKGIIIERYNLSSNPQEFVNNKTINDLLNSKGMDILPAVVVEDEVVKTGGYPSNEEIAGYLGLSVEEFATKAKIKIKKTGCGCEDGCC